MAERGGGGCVRLCLVVRPDDVTRLRDLAGRVALKPAIVGRLLLQRGLDEAGRDPTVLVTRPPSAAGGGTR